MEHESISLTAEKYTDPYSFDVEKQAVEQFDDIKRGSTNSLRTSQRLMVTGSAIVLLLAAILGVFAFATNSRTTHDMSYLYEGPLTVRYYAERVESAMLRAYAAMRNLALSRADDRERITRCMAEVEESVSQLDFEFKALCALDLAEADESLRPEFNELRILLAEWSEMRVICLDYVMKGDMDACRAMLIGEGGEKASEITEQIALIVRDATALADEDHREVLARSMTFSAYSILLLLLILIIGLAVIAYMNRHFGKAVALVEDAQSRQAEILDELVVMDETLRQNVAELERESAITREMQEKYANSLEATNDAIWELDLRTGEFFASEKWEEITGIKRMPVYDRRSLFRHIYREDRKDFRNLFRKNSEYFNIQIRAYNADGSLRWLSVRGKWLDKYRMTGSVSDVTLKRQAEQYIEYMAYHDETTGLPNRTMFIRKLDEALQRSREDKTSGCILFIDLDNFKLINDSHGHDFGDRMLVEVAGRFLCAVGKNATIARFGGDEFLVLIEDISGVDDVLENIERLAGTLEKPIDIDGGLFYVTASIGASVFPDDGDDVSRLLKNADSAMYESKSAGRNTFVFYSNDMSDKIVRKAAISDVLHSAAESGAVWLAFQPQYSLKENRVTGCEALMRLRDPELGFISPAEFIPIAEETHLIIPLGYWAIRRAIETDLELQKQGVDMGSVSVNVSEIQLREADFLRQVTDIAAEYGYPASRLHFEVTEGVLQNNLDQKIGLFNALRGLGFRIELDDFGTGYSSLNYVRMIPLDTIKIDKCFTDEIGVSREKEGLIDIIIRLADMFGANVIAEGVETAGQVDFFRQKGGVAIQGYYCSRPLEAGDLPARIEELNSLSVFNH